MIDVVRINGVVHSWGHQELRFDGEVLNKYTAVDYDDKLTRNMIWGGAKSRAPIGSTAPKYEPGKLKISGYSGAAAEFKKWFASKAPDGRSVSLAVVQATLQLSSPNDIPVMTSFHNVTWATCKNTAKEGTDGLTCDIELDYEYTVDTIDGVVVTTWDSSEETL